MATIKIKELPIKKLVELSPEDIMVVEDSTDTKQITIEDLQIFFSADNKITALKELLESELNKISKDLQKKIDNLDTGNDELKVKLENLFNDHENTKKRLGNLIEKVVDIENILNTTVERVEKTEQQIKNLQNFSSELEKKINKNTSDIASNKELIDANTEKNKEQNERLDGIDTSIKNIDTKVDDNIKRIDSVINNNATSAKEYSDQLYDQIMMYIDYYHHFHEDPPNFDDPNTADNKQIDKILKVGTIYETIDDNFNPKDNLPGTWKYVGDTHVYDTKCETALIKHTFVRME